MQKASQPITSESPSVNRAADFDEFFTAGRLAMLLGLLILIAYPDVVLGSHAFFYRDAGLFAYPFAYYFHDSFWQGELPLWNPYTNCGIPFLAQWNALVLYPLSLFYLILPLPWSMNYFILGHLFLAAIGMYFLARRWFGNHFAASIAGLIFAWNGLTLHALMFPANLATLAWMPWVVLLMERAWNEGGRWIIWGSLIGALQMLTGAPETILLTWIIVGAFLFLKIFQDKSLFWIVGKRGIIVVLIVIGLSAAQLFPFLDFLRHGHRNNSFGGDEWSMPAWGWANFLVPLFRCTSSVIGVFSQDEQQWTSSYYVGTGCLALAWIAAIKVRQPRIFLLSFLAVTGVLFAMGDAGFILPAIKHLVSAIGFIRFPIKFVVVSIFSLPLLAAAGVVWLKNVDVQLSRRTLLETAAIFSLAVFIILVIANYFPFPKDTWNSTWRSGLSRLLFLGLIFAGLFYQRNFQKKFLTPIVSLGILMSFGFDIWTHTPRQVPTVITRAYESFPRK